MQEEKENISILLTDDEQNEKNQNNESDSSGNAIDVLGDVAEVGVDLLSGVFKIFDGL